MMKVYDLDITKPAMFDGKEWHIIISDTMRAGYLHDSVSLAREIHTKYLREPIWIEARYVPIEMIEQEKQ